MRGLVGKLSLIVVAAFVAGAISALADTWLLPDGSPNLPVIAGQSVIGTTIYTTEMQLDTGTKTASASGGFATLNKNAGTITSQSLITPAGGQFVLTLTDSTIFSSDQVFASVRNGTNASGTPGLMTVEPHNGSATIVVQNFHPTDPFNGTLVIAFARFRN